MAEKDDYDRAWDRYVKAGSNSREVRPGRVRTLGASRVSGVILLGLGSIIAALGSEALAVYNACFADPACYPSVSELPFGEFFGILATGITLIVAGGSWLAFNLRFGLSLPVTKPTS